MTLLDVYLDLFFLRHAVQWQRREVFILSAALRLQIPLKTAGAGMSLRPLPVDSCRGCWNLKGSL